jgi:hypothetical protein
MRTGFSVIALSSVMLISAAGCGDDDDDAGGGSDNTLTVTAREYAFDVEGEIQAGSVSIAVDNAGEEVHELAIGKLVDGKSVDDVRAALEAAGDSEDALDGIAESDSAIDSIGGIQAPGTGYTITGAGVEPGEYVLLCFIPNSEGVPHFSLGMVTGFTVSDGEATAIPDPDVTYTADTEGLQGPAELDAGETSIEIVNESATSREVSLFKIAEGKTLDDVAAFFESAEEGPPDFAAAPLEFFAFVFDGDSDRTITVDLTAGQWALQTSDPEQPFEGPPTEDPHAILLTVS